MRNGFFHSWALTTGWFPDEIHMTPRNHAVTERACRKCHEEIVAEIERSRRHKEEAGCLSCRRNVGHPH